MVNYFNDGFTVWIYSDTITQRLKESAKGKNGFDRMNSLNHKHDLLAL